MVDQLLIRASVIKRLPREISVRSQRRSRRPTKQPTVMLCQPRTAPQLAKRSGPYVTNLLSQEICLVRGAPAITSLHFKTCKFPLPHPCRIAKNKQRIDEPVVRRGSNCLVLDPRERFVRIFMTRRILAESSPPGASLQFSSHAEASK